MDRGPQTLGPAGFLHSMSAQTRACVKRDGG